MYPHVYNVSAGNLNDPGVYAPLASFVPDPIGSSTQVTRTQHQSAGNETNPAFTYLVNFTSTVTVTDLIVEFQQTSPTLGAASIIDVQLPPAAGIAAISFAIDTLDDPSTSECDSGQRCWADSIDLGAIVAVGTSLEDSAGTSTQIQTDDLMFGGSAGSGNSCPTYQQLQADGFSCPGSNVCLPQGCMMCPSPFMMTGTGSPCTDPQAVICGCQ